MKFIIFIIWLASTIDIFSTLQLANFRFSGVLWMGISFVVFLRTLRVYPFDCWPRAPLRHNIWYIIALAYFAVRTLDSVNIVYAIVDLQSLFLPIMVGLLAYSSVKKDSNTIKIETTIMKSILVPVVLLGIGLATGLSTFVEGVGQKGFIGARSISLYGITVLSIALSVLVYENKDKYKKRLAILSSSICLFNIIATLSRTALLSSFAMLLVIGFFTMNIRNFLKSIAVIGLVIIITMQWQPMAERLMPKDASSIAAVAQSGEFTSGRALLWTFIVQEGSQSPLIGSGTGNVKALIENNMRSSGILPHNEYLRFYYDGGIVGVMIMCAALFSRIRLHFRGWRDSIKLSDLLNAKWNLASLLATVAMFTSAFFDNVFLYQFMLCIVFIIYGVTDKLSNLNNSKRVWREKFC